MAVTSALILIFVGAIFLWSLLDRWKSHVLKRPPSPLKLPIFGHLLHLTPSLLDPNKLKIKWKFMVDFMNNNYKPPYIITHELSKQYGPLTNVKFGVNNSSIIFNNGKPYREIKHFTVKNLKDFGFGKKQNMETAVEDELVDFLHYFQQTTLNDGPRTIKMEHMFTLPVLNILWIMVAGLRFSYDDEKLHRLIKVVEEISKTHDIGGNILMAFPGLRFLFPELTGHAHQLRLYSKLHQFFRDIMHMRLAENGFLQFDCADTPRDFTDIFIQEMNKRKKVNGNESQIFTEEQFIMVCLDLFTAGAETTANTLDFAMFYLMLNQHVQKKVQAEIDEVIGPNRLPRLKDRHMMPYTEATLLETQRMCNVIPLVHRVSIADTTLGPYNIQKGDVMVMNTYSIHMDERIWGDPHVFRPERFLDKDGNVNNLPSFMPFGMGKRVCIGETLARHTMFTFFTAIMQRYSITPAEKYKVPEVKPVKGYTLNPEPFYTYVQPRF
ncbi:unnamed protein product [Orchesella dallaii]|uniref:Methyl farnesoate epoxidase n=1 Tax=Orchesella dallaii TaxID=48710 RepID=A0ABP1RJ91_9HEXA